MPHHFVESDTGLLLATNGIDAVLRWDGHTNFMEPAGILAPTVAPVISSSGVGTITGTYTAYVRFVDVDGLVSNLSPISNSITISNKSTISYNSVTGSSQTRVVRKQILRNTSGQSRTYYVDVDTTDVTNAGPFTSTRSDTELSTQEAVTLLTPDGRPLANLHDPPPNTRPFMSQHLTRIFAAGDEEYSEGSVAVTFGSTGVQGIGTHWPETLEGRFLDVRGASKRYEITAVDATNQVLTIGATYVDTTDPFADYSIRISDPEKNQVPYTEAGLAESWPPINALSIPSDGDRITGLMSMRSFLYILKREHIYRLSTQNNPEEDGFIFLAPGNRGCVNNRCWSVVGDAAFMLDEGGLHRFDGGESTPVSDEISNVFTNKESFYAINWECSRFFHAVQDTINNVIRWLVCMAGDYLPRHAIALNFKTGKIWIERYFSYVGGSCTGRTGAFSSSWRSRSGQQVFLGSQAKRVYALNTSSLDGISPEAGTLRGKVSSSTLFSITDAVAEFPSVSLVGVNISIFKGEGKGQSRIIESLTNKTVRVTQPWNIKPDTTSYYQIGGIPYRYRSARFQFNNSETRNARGIRLLYKPSQIEGDICNLKIFDDFEIEPTKWQTDQSPKDTFGVTYKRGDAEAVLDLTKKHPSISVRLDGHKEAQIDAPRMVSFEITGVTSQSGFDLRQLIIDGVAGNARTLSAES